MGFLENLLKKESRKIISGVMDAVADTVADSVKDAIGQAGNKQSSQSVKQTKHSEAVQKNADEEDCCFSEEIVEERIRKILASDFAGMELKKKIASNEIGAGHLSWNYTYGVYKDGAPVAMVNVLDNKNDYKRKIVLQSRQACADAGIGYVHFLLHLPNRSSYIKEQLKKIIPA